MARRGVQEYLDAIQHLQEESEGEVSISVLAERLGVSRPSVSEMIRKLTEMGLVHHVPYGKVSLTEKGEHTVHSLSRRHCLWEIFLVRHLGLDAQQAYEAACELEHSTSSFVEEKLDDFLGHPELRPHSQPIPRAQNDTQ